MLNAESYKTKIEELLQTSPILGELSGSLATRLGLDAQNISVVLTFFPVMVKDDGEVFIVTGTKDKPLGISTSSSHFVIFIRNEGFVVYEKKAILDFMKRNWNNKDVIEKSLDEEYKNYGVKFNIIKNIIKLKESS